MSRLLKRACRLLCLRVPALAEFVEFERQREACLGELLRKVRLHDVEQAGAGGCFRGIAASCADFQDGMHESGVAQRAVGDAEILAGDGAHAHAAGRKHRCRPRRAAAVIELRELAAELAEAAVAAQVRAVFQCKVMCDMSGTDVHGGDGAAHRENRNRPVVLQPARGLARPRATLMKVRISNPPWPASR